MPRSKKVVEDILTTGKTIKSYEEGIDHLYQFTLRGNRSYNYCFLFREEDGTLKLYERVSMPCWGATREYKCGTRPDDFWPSDLREPRHIFPKTGNPIAVSFQFHLGYGYSDKSSNKYQNHFLSEFAFNSKVSPWRSVLKDFELTIDNDMFKGVVFKDTNFDPTVMISLMRNCGMLNNNVAITWSRSMKEGSNYHPALVYLKSRNSCNIYGFSTRIDIYRFVNGLPFDLSNGGTFFNRESYNRPDIDYLFGGKNNVGTVFRNKTLKQLHEIMEEQEKEYQLKVA